MKVLVISQYFDPDVTAAASRITETVDLLDEMGHKMTVITATPHKTSVTNFVEFDIKARAKIIRVPVPAPVIKGSSGSLMRQYLFFSFRAMLKVLKNIWKISPDVVFVSSPPLPIVLVSLLLKIVFRVPIVLDVRDIWPESAVNIGKLRKGSILEKLGLWLEKVAYYHADQITCVSSNMKSYINSKSATPTTVVYNAVRIDHNKNSLFQTLNGPEIGR